MPTLAPAHAEPLDRSCYASAPLLRIAYLSLKAIFFLSCPEQRQVFRLPVSSRLPVRCFFSGEKSANWRERSLPLETRWQIQRAAAVFLFDAVFLIA
jgi:hypothetical protein